MSIRQPALTRAKPVSQSASPDDLWHEAFNSIPAEDRQAFHVNSANKLGILQEILAITNERRRLCLEKRWKYRRGDKEVIIRDKLEKVTTWIEKFKEVGTVAVQYDPVHTALPWAGVLFLLQIAINDGQIFGAMVEGVELVSNTTARYAILEKIYLGEGKAFTMHDQLSTALVKLYMSILRYLSKAKKYFSENTAKRMVKSTVCSAEASVHTYLSIISKKAASVDSCIRVLDAKGMQKLHIRSRRLEELLLGLEQPIRRSAIQLSEIHDHLKRNERAKILTWLSVVPTNLHHTIEGENFMPASCSWIDRHPGYVQWRKSSESSVLWIHGIPGCGKTKMIYYVIRRLLEENSNVTNPAPVAYFYCKRNPAEPKRTEPCEVMRSLLKQLASLGPDYPIRYPLVQAYEKRAEAVDADASCVLQLSALECVPVILEILDQSPATIIIDAFDECNPVSRHELFSALNIILKQSASLVKVIIASRDDGDISSHLANSANVCIRAENNRDDIGRFVEYSLERALETKRLLNGRMSERLKTHVIAVLNAGAGGMFRWVTLQIENLCDSQRIKIEDDVQHEVGRLPRTLKESYDPLVGRILSLADPSRVLAEQLFKWLLCAQKLMKFSELKAAMKSSFAYKDLSVDKVLDMCSNLVVVDNLGVFRFAHLSVRECLECHKIFSATSSHALVLERCLEAYTSPSPELESQPYNENGFILKSYAMVYWPIHCQLSTGPGPNESFQRHQVLKFIFEDDQPSTAFTDWVEDTQRFSEYPGSIDCDYDLLQKLGSMGDSSSAPLFIACCFDLPWILHQLAASGFSQWTARNKREESGIYLAAKWCNYGAVQWLLENGVMSHGDTEAALYAAVLNQDEQLINIFLQRQVKGHLPIQNGESSLQLAVRMKDIRTVRCMIDKSVEIPPEIVAETLCAAYENYSDEIFRILSSWCMKLTAAEFLMVLLCIDTEDETCLEYMLTEAKRHDQEKFATIAQLKAGNYLEMMQPCSDGSFSILFNGLHFPPFCYVALANDETLAELLFSLGNDVNQIFEEQGDSYRYYGIPALYVAVKLDRLSIASLLLAHGANVDWKDNKGRPLLIHATKNRNLEMVQLLQKSGANVEACDSKKKTALWISVESHQHKILDFLLRVASAAPNVNASNLDTPLTMAVKAECNQCVRRLLVFGAYVEAEQSDRDHVLHHAVMSNSARILQSLLARGVSPDPQDASGRTPLHLAVLRQNATAARLLLKAFAATDTGDVSNRSPLHDAVSAGNETLVRVLVEYGASPNTQSESGGTALHEAVLEDDINILRLILNVAPDIDAPDIHGNSALHWALDQRRPSSYVDLLVAAGASFNHPNNDGETPHDLVTRMNLRLEKISRWREEEQQEEKAENAKEEGTEKGEQTSGLRSRSKQARRDKKLEFLADSSKDSGSDTEYVGLIELENSLTFSQQRRVKDSDNPFFEDDDIEAVNGDVETPLSITKQPHCGPSVDYYTSHGVENWSNISSMRVVPSRPLCVPFRRWEQ
ncbi:hypothetical protein EPUS_07326 [Endocarpon pusillum Z07020]|uniref:NWD NACHT-NTPase N-terminal domain-containing protein n=1 Tax=Endocarpon pusillum (strain Z07020 / HMAS-L-300199) TaxID=1263415 RepID=U1GWH8_ENDPU|nr:uncharacterized protein EPUS_07326 [Endocarpon pusillum Z07020]ERF76446.1 hypothetical protein EPUS_07326 [Endocarpon pusillum Z07020]